MDFHIGQITGKPRGQKSRATVFLTPRSPDLYGKSASNMASSVSRRFKPRCDQQHEIIY
jgi:hypothetical protein